MPASKNENLNDDPVVIVGAARTPMAGFQGEFAGLSASELGAAAIKAAIAQSGLKNDDIDEILMGNVLSAGQGQAPARQAGFGAGLSENVPATTLNKMCGSGMKTTMIGFDQLLAGNGSAIVVGGMESMSNAPYLLPKMRGGARLGHGEVKDHMFLDGLEDAYEPGKLMGAFAEDCAEKFQFTRDAQDAYALRSLDNALKAEKDGHFKNEIAEVSVKDKKGETIIASDEQPRKAKPEKIPQLKPAFRKDGTVTAANASSISDGAAAFVLMRQSDAEKKGANIVARILGHASYAHEPQWFTTAPVPAMQKLMEKIGWQEKDVDLYEINEAFAVVPMAAEHLMGFSREKLNIHGGACALGHPIGASGARIIVTLLNALKTHNLKRGMAGICIGGGEGTALAVEIV